MAVLQMQRICICALKKERKQILEFLQRRGVIEINDVIPEDSVFRKMDVTVSEQLLERNILSAKEALEILEQYVPEKKALLAGLNGRNEVTTDIYDSFSVEHDSMVRTSNRLCKLAKEIAERKAEILKLEVQNEMLFPWSSLDIPLSFKGTKTTAGFIGTLPNTWELEQIYEQLAEQSPLNVDIISSSREQTCIFVLCGKEQADAVSEALRTIGFSYPASSIDKAPSIQVKENEEQINIERIAILNAEEEIVAYEKEREKIRFLEDYETIRVEKYQVIHRLVQSNKVFVMTGYIPEKECSDLKEKLNQKFELVIEFEEPEEQEEVPVLLENNWFANPLESTVEAFSPPGKGDIDPTMMMSLFYYLLFGLMLSDAGYGLIITLGCGFGLLKFKGKLEENMKRTLKMYLFCGISTVFWGIMFSSYFGDIVDVVSANFFGKTVSIPPVWFLPVDEPMRMLVFSMALGIIHIFTGLGLKLYQSIKQKDFKSALYDVVFWYVLLGSCIVILLSMQMVGDIFGLRLAIPSKVIRIAEILALISAIGITLTNGRESRNPVKRILKGAYALYGISGYLSDVLSYSRLLALGLATGVIASVINTMAAMTAGSIIGVIPFTIIVVFGHALNLGINALGAYVHTNRLQYVEFFGKFYEGGGRKFHPFSVKSKYYKIKEN